MAIKISGLTIIDDSRNISSASNINATGIITASTISANEFLGTGDRLIFSPTITSFSPSDGQTNITALNDPPNIVIVYNQEIGIGTTGQIQLRKDTSSGTLVESFSVGISTRVTVSNQTLTIIPTNKFDYNQEYYVVVPTGSVTNKIGGKNNLLNTYNFTTESSPTLSSTSPGIGSTNVFLTSNIVLTFNKSIRSGVGTITLRTVSAGGTIVESYDVSSSNRLTFSGDTLTIDPTNNLIVGANHFVVIPSNAIAGYAGISTYSFTAISFALLSINPPNASTNVGIDTNISLNFTSAPIRGTGTVALRSQSASGPTIESFDAASSNRISVTGCTWTLDPTSSLGCGVTFFTVIPSTAICNFTGINTTGGDSHCFTTPYPPLGSSYEGGFLICCVQPSRCRWIVSPRSAEVSRSFGSGDSNTLAQQVSGCTGWFVPSIAQLQNPGFTCRAFWDSYSNTNYWSSTQQHQDRAYNMSMVNGGVSLGVPDEFNLGQIWCVRSFRTVTY